MSKKWRKIVSLVIVGTLVLSMFASAILYASFF
jgi:virulence family protein